MADPAVVNASPLILLSAAGLTDLLQLAGSPIFVPRAVVEEVHEHGPTDTAVTMLEQSGWLTIVPPQPMCPVIEQWDLGKGESAVLTWAYAHSGTVAILDDLAARRCADSLGIPTRGTLGLVLIAKRRGGIAEARPMIDRLRQVGMYLSDKVVNRALSMVGE